MRPPRNRGAKGKIYLRNHAQVERERSRIKVSIPDDDDDENSGGDQQTNNQPIFSGDVSVGDRRRGDDGFGRAPLPRLYTRGPRRQRGARQVFQQEDSLGFGEGEKTRGAGAWGASLTRGPGAQLFAGSVRPPWGGWIG
jgi:hypothetical protein